MSSSRNREEFFDSLPAAAKNRAAMRNRKSTEIAAVLTTCVALAVIILSLCEFAPRFDRTLHAAIGTALAKEAVGLVGPGGQIKVIARDTKAFPQPALDLLLESFTREVRRAGATMVATQAIQTDPLRRVEIPSGDFFELLRRSTAEQVIVSLLGPPLLSEEQRKQLGRVKPKVVAFCSGELGEQLELRPLFDAGLLHAAVVSRRVSPVALGTAHKTSCTFDQLYQTVNAATPSASLSPAGAESGSGDR